MMIMKLLIFLITYQCIIMPIFRTTMYTEYSVLKELQLSLGNLHFSAIFTYNDYRLAWYSFMKQLDINYDEGFVCPLCYSQPCAVIMDATSLAFRKELDYCELFPKTPPKTEQKAGR